MDPDATLAEIRKHLATYLATGSRAEAERAADLLIMAFQGLDEWLSRGGFLPRDWEDPDRK